MGYPFDGYVVSVSVLETPRRDVDISDNQNFSVICRRSDIN